MNMNAYEPDLIPSAADDIALRFHLLGQPARLRILLAIGTGEACVCHLEACLGYRQAYISQQMMLLRDAGMVNPRRVGKHIYYSLADVKTIDLIRGAGLPDPEQYQTTEMVFSDCACPRCSPSHPADEEQTASTSEEMV